MFDTSASRAEDELPRMVQCPGTSCNRLVLNSLNHATFVALGMVCCSQACHESVYDLTRYVDAGTIQVDEGLIIDLTTTEYRVLDPP